MISLSQVFAGSGFSVTCDGPVQLVRHTPEEQGYRILEDIAEKGDAFLNAYQSNQKTDVLTGRYLVVFLGLDDCSALFWHIYENHGVIKGSRPALPEGFPAALVRGDIVYDLRQLEACDELNRRLVVKWPNPRNWQQTFTGATDEKLQILELRPSGRFREFPGESEVLLSFVELKYLTEHEAANPAWSNRLSAQGIYLIHDRKSGENYIGSARGEEGIWGRWKEYVRTGHGGNQKLQELLAGQPDYRDNFQFSVLEILPFNYTEQQVLAAEALYKKKLGPRLNSN